MQSMVATITLLVIVMGSPSYSEAQADDSKLISYCYSTGHYNSSIIACKCYARWICQMLPLSEQL